jgi:hypothetical protein
MDNLYDNGLCNLYDHALTNEKVQRGFFSFLLGLGGKGGRRNHDKTCFYFDKISAPCSKNISGGSIKWLVILGK